MTDALLASLYALAVVGIFIVAAGVADLIEWVHNRNTRTRQSRRRV